MFNINILGTHKLPICSNLELDVSTFSKNLTHEQMDRGCGKLYAKRK